MPPHTKSSTTVVTSTNESPLPSERICHTLIVPHVESQVFTDGNNNNEEKISAQPNKEDYYEPIPLVRSATVVGEKYEPHIRWPDLMAQLFLHAGFLYGLYFLLTGQVQIYTYLWGKLIIVILESSIILTFLSFVSLFTCIWIRIWHHCWSTSTLVGIHIFSVIKRNFSKLFYRSHKSYKAKWQLRVLLIFLFTITGQVSFIISLI